MALERSTWQTKLRTRAFRPLGWFLPLLILASLASSILPSSHPKEILQRGWGESVLIRGRLDIPKRSQSEITTAWVIEGPLPEPKSGVLNIRVKTLDNSFDTKKRWNFAPRVSEQGTWSSTFILKVPSSQMLAYRIRGEGSPHIPATATLRVITDPARQVDVYLRVIEILIFPSLAMVILAVAMLIFVKFSSR